VFRLENIHGARNLLKNFVRPRSFNLADLWREEVSRFEASLRRAKATIRVSPNALSRIDRLGADAAERIQAVESDARGWREASIWIESINHAAALLLAFSDDIEVIAPQELRVELAQRAARVCALYK
jgi:predicted DNA-binding transcriptional regulator YafY